MSTQTHDRWFLTPAVLRRYDDTGKEFVTPKYADTAGVTSWSGETIDPATVTDFYPALTDAYPDVEGWYIVHMAGDGTTGYQTLDTIGLNQDTRTLADLATGAAPVLDSHFSALDKTPSEWANAFRVE